MKKTTAIIIALALGFAGAPAQSSVTALNSAAAIIDDVRSELAPDSRQSICEVRAFTDPDGVLVVGGAVSDSLVGKTIRGRLAASHIDYADSITVLPYNSWAQVRLSVASLRTAGRHSAEMATQAVMGTPLRVLQKGKEWWRVQCPDGYIAWIPTSSVVKKSVADLKAWRARRRFIVTSRDQIRVYSTPTATDPRSVVSDLVNGCIVSSPASAPHVSNGRLEIELPDGRRGYADASALRPVEEWAAQNFNADTILDMAYSLEGTPYLWGGTSSKAADCSGLAKVSYFANGIILLRDASQQARTGRRIEARDWRRCQAGDLLFFGNAKTGKVTHVAIYDRDGNYVHSSGRVRRNSVDPESESYLTTPFLHAVRIAGMEETPGIIRARNHPWYFDK